MGPAATAAGRRGQPRLLHVFPSFEFGGAQVRFAALAAGLGDRFSHTVMALDGSYGAAARLGPGAPVQFADPLPHPGLARRLGLYRDWLARSDADLLLTYNWGAIEFALANLAVGKPHIHVEDGFGREEARAQFRRRIWARRLALRRSRVVVPSLTLRTIAQTIWRLDMRRVHYIPNGVAAQPGGSRLERPPSFDLRPDLPRIVWAGALRPEKNPVRLLRAFAPLKAKAVLVLIGDGPEREAVLREADRLQLGAHLQLLRARPDVRDVIMHGQVLALSSDTEQMPLVVLEAMEAGLAIASFDVGDVRKMVAAENRAFVVAPSDDLLSAALERLVEDRALCALIGAANQRRARSVFGLATMVERYGDLFDTAIHPARDRLAGRRPREADEHEAVWDGG